MVIGTLVSGATGLKTAGDLVKSLKASITDVAVAERINEILGLLTDARQALLDNQETLFELSDEVRALKEEGVRLRQWQHDAADYDLKDTGRGALAYLPKGMDADPRGGHWHCPQCFAEAKQSLLIPESHGMYNSLHCHRCGWEAVSNGRRLDPQPARGGRR